MVTIAALSVGGMAWAKEVCTVPMTDWQPREAITRLAMDSGWIVRRIRFGDGCYDLVGTGVDGHRIGVKLHPGTLAIVGTDHDDASAVKGEKQQAND